MIKSNFYRRHRLLHLGLALLALCFCGSAFAQAGLSSADDKIWTGAICVPAGGNSWFTTKIRPTNIQNVDAAARYVACSLTVDSEATWSSYDVSGGTNNGTGSVFVDLDYSSAASGTTTCTVQVLDSSTNTIVETQSNAVFGSAGDATVSLTVASSLTMGNGNSRPVGLNCLLPPQVKLTSINLEEYAITDDFEPAAL